MCIPKESFSILFQCCLNIVLRFGLGYLYNVCHYLKHRCVLGSPEQFDQNIIFKHCLDFRLANVLEWTLQLTYCSCFEPPNEANFEQIVLFQDKMSSEPLKIIFRVYCPTRRLQLSPMFSNQKSNMLNSNPFKCSADGANSIHKVLFVWLVVLSIVNMIQVCMLFWWYWHFFNVLFVDVWAVEYHNTNLFVGSQKHLFIHF